MDVAALDAGVRVSVLSSGVRVATDPMAHSQSVAIACFVGVGSRDEPSELAGASHFLEHLLFKGTMRRTAREINRAVDAVGGDFNAYTVRESTVFYVRVPAAHAQFATDLLCEVIASPRFDPADVEIERNVILGELDGALERGEPFGRRRDAQAPAADQRVLEAGVAAPEGPEHLLAHLAVGMGAQVDVGGIVDGLRLAVDLQRDGLGGFARGRAVVDLELEVFQHGQAAFVSGTVMPKSSG